jgi:hypothetical protein
VTRGGAVGDRHQRTGDEVAGFALFEPPLGDGPTCLRFVSADDSRAPLHILNERSPLTVRVPGSDPRPDPAAGTAPVASWGVAR